MSQYGEERLERTRRSFKSKDNHPVILSEAKDLALSFCKLKRPSFTVARERTSHQFACVQREILRFAQDDRMVSSHREGRTLLLACAPSEILRFAQDDRIVLSHREQGAFQLPRARSCVSILPSKEGCHG
jgi:hypothetical protein